MAKSALKVSGPNLSSILDEAPSSVERPKPYPVGSYLTAVHGLPEYGESNKKKTPFVEFTMNFLQAGEDVDADELEAMGGIQGKSIKNTYYTTETAIYRLDEFHEHCGLDLNEEHSRRQRNEMVAGRQVWVKIRHEQSDDGQQMFARISGTAPVEE